MTRSVDELSAALARGSGTEDFEEDAKYLAGVLAELGALGHAATPALAHVLPCIPHGHYEVRDAAMAAIREMIPEVVATDLVELARAPATREGAVKALDAIAQAYSLGAGLVGGEPAPVVVALRDQAAAVPLLLELFASEPDGFRRSELPRPLGLLGAGDDRVLAALEKAASDPDTWVRQWTAHGLVHLGDRGIPALARLLHDFGEADEAAVYALGRIGSPAAIAELKKFARTAKGSIRAQARDTVGSIEARAAREKPAKRTARPARPAAAKPAKPKRTAKPKPKPKRAAKPKPKPKPAKPKPAKPKRRVRR